MVAALNSPDIGQATGLRFRLFVRLWGVALVAHVVGNWGQPDVPSLVGFTNLAVGVMGILLVWRPRQFPLVAAAGFTIASMLAEIPFTGNHWIVAGLVSLAILLSPATPTRWFSAARLILLTFYAFAAFAKLNSGFFDPTVSCAVFYANQTLNSFGLPGLPVDSNWSLIPIWVTAVVELSIPILLLVRRWRFAGVLMASLFHILISFDLGQHFYDFTAMLLPLFTLFLSDESIQRLTDPIKKERPRTGTLVIMTAVLIVLVVLAVSPTSSFSAVILNRLPFAFWIPASVYWLYALVKARAPGQRLLWRPGWAWVAVVLALLNGLTPYVEVKTAYGFNMYANLVSAGGASNHFVIRHTMPLRDGYASPVEILESSDPGLEIYRDRGYLIAYPQFQRYVAGKPITVDFARDGRRFSLDTAERIEPGPWWWRYLPLRSIDSMSPPRCQDVFLPAL